MYGGEARLLTALVNAVSQDLAPRVGVGEGKFPGLRRRPRQPTPGGYQGSPGRGRLPSIPAGGPAAHVHRRSHSDELRRFGLRTLGDVAAMNDMALTDRFGPEGRRAWELAQGIDGTPLVPMKHEESVAEHTALPVASASLELLLAAVDVLLRRVFARPAMRGRYARGAELECILFRAQPWRKDFRFQQPVGDWQRASRILRGQLEVDHPLAPVEEVSLALSRITGESGMQLSLLSDLRGDRERRLAQAEQQLRARMGGRPALYRVVPVAPWHPAPELRAMQVPLDPSGAEGMKALSLPSPAAVSEGPEGGPAAVLLGERWQRVARIEEVWCFDLWWMPQPLTRTYYRVGREDGGELTLFRDHHSCRWFRQDT